MPNRKYSNMQIHQELQFYSQQAMQKGKTLAKLQNSVRIRTKDRLHLLTLLKSRADHSIISSQSVDQKKGGLEQILKDFSSSRKNIGALPLIKKHHQKSQQNIQDNGSSSPIKLPVPGLGRAPEEENHVGYTQMLGLLQKIHDQAEELIETKLSKLTKKQELITLKNKGKDEISEKIDHLVLKVKKIQPDLGKYSLTDSQKIQIRNQKITILQKLLAQTSIQSDVLKKYYFAINAIKKSPRSKPFPAFQKHSSLQNMIKHKNERGYILPKTNTNKSINLETCHKSSFQSPKQDQYESYRRKNQEFSANAQPFPRSSYQRQFLINPVVQTTPYKNLDTYAGFGKSRIALSTYVKDFQRMKTQQTDIRELDSYKNKIKDLNMFFRPQDKQKAAHQFSELSRKYWMGKGEQMNDLELQQKSISVLTKNFSSVRKESQTRERFLGEKGEKGKIKNKELQKIRQKYKSFLHR